jgi:hypothetical protein
MRLLRRSEPLAFMSHRKGALHADLAAFRLYLQRRCSATPVIASAARQSSFLSLRDRLAPLATTRSIGCPFSR